MNDKHTETSQAELELSVIKKIMEDSRTVVINNGWHYIFWGVIVSSALIINYFMALNRVSGYNQGLMWLILMVSAVITGSIIERFAEKKRKVKTFAGKLLGSLWFAGGISMFIFGFLGTFSNAYNPVYICPIISTVLGTAYYTSGAIQQIRWLQNISYGWWAGAIVLFLLPGIHSLLVFGGMMICFQVIPGFIIHRKFRNKQLRA